MGQALQTRRAESAQRVWLSLLIDGFEEISHAENRALPCDRHALAALRAQLAAPAGLVHTSLHSRRH